MRHLWGPLLIITALGLPGVFIFVWGIDQLMDLRDFHGRAKVTDGRVTEMKLIRSTGEDSVYELAVVYRGERGVQKTLHRQVTNSSLREGERVDVLYADSDVRVRGINTSWQNPIIMTVSGLFWTAFAAMFMFISVRAMKAS